MAKFDFFSNPTEPSVGPNPEKLWTGPEDGKSKSNVRLPRKNKKAPALTDGKETTIRGTVIYNGPFHYGPESKTGRKVAIETATGLQIDIVGFQQHLRRHMAGLQVQPNSGINGKVIEAGTRTSLVRVKDAGPGSEIEATGLVSIRPRSDDKGENISIKINKTTDFLVLSEAESFSTEY